MVDMYQVAEGMHTAWLGGILPECFMCVASRCDDTAMHTCLLVVLGILGQCAPVYPYVDLSGWYTLLAISIHGLSDMDTYSILSIYYLS